MKKTTKILMVLGAILISTTLVGAALLQYFGKVETTMNVQQSIMIGDGDGWYLWNEPVERDLGEVVHCTDYCYKLLIKNQACSDATVSFEDICIESPDDAGSEGIDICHFVFGDTQTITLTQKEIVWGQSPWYPLPEGKVAELQFNTCGPTFDWEIIANFDVSDYTLIYYANFPEYWDEGPVTILGTGTSGSANVPTMPYADDENALRPISDLGESYCHNYGAKFWLVPTDAIDGNDVNWGMADDFLFETDLGFYLDCDNWEPVCLPNVYPIFDTDVLLAESQYCWISCYHVDFNIMPGIYAFETIVDAEEVTQQI